MNESLRTKIEASLEQIAPFIPRIAAALLIFAIAVLAGRVFAGGVVRLIESSNLTRTHKLFFKNLTFWFFTVLGLVAGLSVLGLQTVMAGFLAGSGVIAIVLGFAFREIGENLLSGLFLAFSRPFNVGDFILSETLEGEIREIELRYTHIRTADGRDIYIPNSQMFNKPLVNFTRDGLRRPSFTVGIDYANDSRLACDRLLEVVRGVPEVLGDPEPSVIVAALAPQYVELEVSFWVNTFEFRSDAGTSSRIAQQEAVSRIRSEVMESCRRTLEEGGFTVSANVTTNVALDKPSTTVS